MKNIIITTYFTKDIDPQRNHIWDTDDFNIIELFFESIVKHDLSLIILHDNCSDNFVNEYTTNKIKFVKVNSSGLNMVDIRWKLYSEFLSDTEADNVFFMDVSDVIILKNPFDYIQPDKIYIGDEMSINKENYWMMERYDMLNLDTKDYLDDTVLNCGVLGGSYNDMLSFCRKMSDLIDKNSIKETTVDMAAANHILYTEYRNRIVHGPPLNTLYRGGVNPYLGDDNGFDYCYIQHK